MSDAALRALIGQVLVEPDLWPGLLALDDRDGFARAVCALAGERGLLFTEADLIDALISRRREWFERWV